jgi:GTP pyrophosphokinase
VQILTDANRHPSKDWLKFVRTAKARSRINHYIRTEQLAQSIQCGRDILEKQGRRLNLVFHKAIKETDQERLLKEFNLKSLEGLFAGVHEGRIKAHTVLRFMKEQLAAPTAVPPPPARAVTTLPARSAEEKKEESITIAGGDKIPYTLARCCHPVPGDQIIGYTSIGRGLIVHTAGCQAILNVDPERLLSAHWGEQKEQPFPVVIEIKAKNDIGVLSGVTGVLMHERINIDSGRFHANVDGNSEINLTLEVRDTVQLYQVIARLRAVPSVLEVIRSSGVKGGQA